MNNPTRRQLLQAGAALGTGIPAGPLGTNNKDPRKYVVISDELAQGAPVNGKKLSPMGRMARDPKVAPVLKQHREALAKWYKKYGIRSPLSVKGAFPCR